MSKKHKVVFCFFAGINSIYKIQSHFMKVSPYSKIPNDLVSATSVECHGTGTGNDIISVHYVQIQSIAGFVLLFDVVNTAKRTRHNFVSWTEKWHENQIMCANFWSNKKSDLYSDYLSAI